MKTVYICSPYRAEDSAEMDRNIEYAQELTREALRAGLAPITPHLYMTQCLDEKKPEERAQGMAAGQELLKACDYVIVGMRYGVSEGMLQEIEAAGKMELPIIEAEQLALKLEYEKRFMQRFERKE